MTGIQEVRFDRRRLVTRELFRYEEADGEGRHVATEHLAAFESRLAAPGESS